MCCIADWFPQNAVQKQSQVSHPEHRAHGSSANESRPLGWSVKVFFPQPQARAHSVPRADFRAAHVDARLMHDELHRAAAGGQAFRTWTTSPASCNHVLEQAFWLESALLHREDSPAMWQHLNLWFRRLRPRAKTSGITIHGTSPSNAYEHAFFSNDTKRNGRTSWPPEVAGDGGWELNKLGSKDGDFTTKRHEKARRVRTPEATVNLNLPSDRLLARLRNLAYVFNTVSDGNFTRVSGKRGTPVANPLRPQGRNDNKHADWTPPSMRLSKQEASMLATPHALTVMPFVAGGTMPRERRSQGRQGLPCLL